MRKWFNWLRSKIIFFSSIFTAIIHYLFSDKNQAHTQYQTIPGSTDIIIDELRGKKTPLDIVPSNGATLLSLIPGEILQTALVPRLEDKLLSNLSKVNR